MRAEFAIPGKRRGDAGSALLIAVFFVALLLVATTAAVPNLLTEGRREKEDELIWRGNQYVRGIRAYYRKYGRFPQSLEDLTKPKNEIRFMRQAYKDPMNSADGSWRLIYVGPGGQLIGSVKKQVALTPTGGQAPPGSITGDAGKRNPSDEDEGEPGKQPAGSAPPSEPTPLAPSAAEPQGPVFGGSLIGVASKINRRSIRVYNDASRYREWEFIWDPTKDLAAGAQPGGPAVGTPVGAPVSPSPQPQTAPPSPQNPPPPPR